MNKIQQENLGSIIGVFFIIILTIFIAFYMDSISSILFIILLSMMLVAYMLVTQLQLSDWYKKK